MKTKINFFLIFFLVTGLFAQPITWTDISSGYSLPASVKLYKGIRSSPALSAFYLDINLNDKSIGIRPYMLSNEKLGIVPFVSRVGALAGINAGYFDVSSTTVLSSVVYPEEVLARTPQFLTRDSKLYPVTRAFFAIYQDRKMSAEWIYHFSAMFADIYKYSQPVNNQQGTPASAPTQAQGKKFDSLHFGFGGGPMLIKQGVGNITYNQEVFFGSGVELNIAQPRTAIGYTSDNHVIMFVADGRYTGSAGLTLTELRDILLNLGCYEAINLDGGGSSQMAIGNKLVNLPEGGTSQRPLPVIVALTVSDSLNFPKPILFDKTIDNGEPGFSSSTGWTTSSNTGYYGSTPALIAPIGTGDKYADYTFNLPQDALYTVQAWWVSSSNRSKTTPYIIDSKLKKDTVKADQTINGSKWVTLGSYYFDNSRPYKVTITNNTNSNQYVCADAVRLISYDSSFITTVFPGKEILSEKNFTLYQNYPNPFNPVTHIKYKLEKSSYISLKLFNNLGKEVYNFFEGIQSSGEHKIIFNNDQLNLSSGVYFCELKMENSNQIKKLVLLK